MAQESGWISLRRQWVIGNSSTGKGGRGGKQGVLVNLIVSAEDALVILLRILSLQSHCAHFVICC
jgi:hypothetical protein